MKYFIRLSIALSMLCCLYSCQKTITDSIGNGSDSSAFFPKQIINSDASSPGSKLYYSLKYATDKSRIDLYLDDTTNSNPYDVLASSYLFNSSGYLTKYSSKFQAGSTFYTDTVFINRSADNKIVSITESYKKTGVRLTNDTSLFGYAIVAGGTTITVAGVSANYDALGGLIVTRDTNVYTYNTANVLQTVKKRGDGHSNSGIYTCSYNANGSLQSIHYADNIYGSSDATFLYSSGLPDAKEDYLATLLLGKDYYLQDIKNYPATGNRYDEPNCCVISITNPHHISNMHVVSNSYGGSTTKDYFYNYQQNKYSLPISVLESGYNQLTEFRY